MKLGNKFILPAIVSTLTAGFFFISAISLGQEGDLFDFNETEVDKNVNNEPIMIENASKISSQFDSVFEGQFFIGTSDTLDNPIFQSRLGKIGISCTGGECVVQFQFNRPEAPPLTVGREFIREEDVGPPPTPSPPPPPTPTFTPPPLPTLTFTANPVSIVRGGTSELSWSSNGVSCLGDCISGDCEEWDSTPPGLGTNKPTSGNQSVSPQVTSGYRLTCFSAGGGSAQRDVTVTVGFLKWREIIPRLFQFLQPIFSSSQ